MLKKEFSVHVGLSDHTKGTVAGIAATSLGATLIEKHFTLSRAQGGVDSSFSLEPDEMRELIVKTNDTYHALGSDDYTVDQNLRTKTRFFDAHFTLLKN